MTAPPIGRSLNYMNVEVCLFDVTNCKLILRYYEIAFMASYSPEKRLHSNCILLPLYKVTIIMPIFFKIKDSDKLF